MAIALGCAWLLGIYLGLHSAPLPLGLFALIGGSSAMLAVIYRRNAGAVIAALMLVVLIAGMWRANLPVDHSAGLSLATHHGTVIRLRGVATADPQLRGPWVDLLVRVEQLAVSGVPSPDVDTSSTYSYNLHSEALEDGISPSGTDGLDSFYQESSRSADDRTIGYGEDDGDLEGVPDEVAAIAIRGDHVRDEADAVTWQPSGGLILTRLSAVPGWRSGDLVELEGRLSAPPEFDGFSYREHLARRGVFSLMSYPRARLLAREQHGWLTTLIDKLRWGAAAHIQEYVPEPAGGLAFGIVLGRRDAIAPGVLESFSRTNTMHIVAISGLHVMLLVGLIFTASRRLLRQSVALALTLISLMLYVAVIGAPPSAVRAAIMGALYLLGVHLGRPHDALTALSLAAVAMTGWQPLTIYELGFQLSFLVTAALVLLMPTVQNWLAGWPRWISGLLAVTLVAQVAALPMIGLTFNRVSPIGPIANLLVVWSLPPALIAGLATVGLGSLWPTLAQLAGWVTWLFLSYMIVIVDLLASLPFAELSIGLVSPALVIYSYCVLAFAALSSKQSPLRGALPSPLDGWRSLTGRVGAPRALAVLAIVVVLVWTGALNARIDRPTVTFIDVGQGDAILIQTPSGQNVLVDGGPNPSTILSALGRRLPFWKQQIDLIVLTHPHDDHLLGLIGVIERYEVRHVLESRREATTVPYLRWRELVDTKVAERTAAEAGQVIVLSDGITLEVVHPQAELIEGTRDDPNNNSVVLRMLYGDVSMLLTGDVEGEGQRAILDGGWDVQSAILKVPHHGASGALLPEFLAEVRPQLAIIQVGAGNRHGHPALGTLRHLSDVRVLRTDLHGSVEIELEPNGYRLRSQR